MIMQCKKKEKHEDKPYVLKQMLWGHGAVTL